MQQLFVVVAIVEAVDTLKVVEPLLPMMDCGVASAGTDAPRARRTRSKVPTASDVCLNFTILVSLVRGVYMQNERTEP
jgi:hypothetical protein